MPAAPARRGHGLGGGLVERGGRREVGRLEELGRLGRVRADDAHDHRHVALLLGPRLDEAVGDLVAAGDAAEDVDEDRVDLRVGQDEPHRRRDLVGSRAAADVEEVGRLAAGPLDEVHRRHRQAGAVDHAADRAVELDEGEARPRAPRGRPGPPRRGRAAPRAAGWRASAESSRVILASRQTSRSTVGAVRAGLADDRQRVDLDEVGVVGEHRPDEALGDRRRRP